MGLSKRFVYPIYKRAYVQAIRFMLYFFKCLPFDYEMFFVTLTWSTPCSLGNLEDLIALSTQLASRKSAKSPFTQTARHV